MTKSTSPDDYPPVSEMTEDMIAELTHTERVLLDIPDPPIAPATYSEPTEPVVVPTSNLRAALDREHAQAVREVAWHREQLETATDELAGVDARIAELNQLEGVGR